MSNRQQIATDTPWRRVFSRFGLNQSALARAIGKDRSKISRALRDDKGLINGRDQELILKAARKLKVEISPRDMTPGEA